MSLKEGTAGSAKGNQGEWGGKIFEDKEDDWEVNPVQCSSLPTLQSGMICMQRTWELDKPGLPPGLSHWPVLYKSYLPALHSASLPVKCRHWSLFWRWNTVVRDHACNSLAQFLALISIRQTHSAVYPSYLWALCPSLVNISKTEMHCYCSERTRTFFPYFLGIVA